MAAMRLVNLSLVLRQLRVQSPMSRVEIADATGLHRTTVSNLMSELLERRLVREAGTEHAGAIGRPRRGVALHGAHIGALGLEVNVDYIAVHGTDLSGRALVERRFAFDAVGAGPDRTLRRLGTATTEAIEATRRAGAAPVGIAVAIPGLVDVGRGIVRLAPNLGWHDVPLADHLAAAIGSPEIRITVDNDANLSAFAEYLSGVAAGTPDLIYLTGEVGVGGGVVVGGMLHRGADGFAGEVGHLPVDPAGGLCGCGRRGCWETKVGLAELVRLAMPSQAYGLDGAAVPDPEERSAQIARGLGEGDPRMLRATAEVGRWLGLGGAIMANLFNPRVIVVGGYFSALAEWLLPHAQAELERLSVASTDGRCRFVASTFGFGAASRGAAMVVIKNLIDDPHKITTTP
ncbi:ROK family transcriptional regulator [Actinocorallia longicatena]|uniref:ROK family transcriptional regulator n=1 Tax=Actinocorallia longicatena TaxID=111803 RepID=A0ABP6QKY9_9ACTN